MTLRFANFISENNQENNLKLRLEAIDLALNEILLEATPTAKDIELRKAGLAGVGSGKILPPSSTKNVQEPGVSVVNDPTDFSKTKGGKVIPYLSSDVAKPEGIQHDEASPEDTEAVRKTMGGRRARGGRISLGHSRSDDITPGKWSKERLVAKEAEKPANVQRALGAAYRRGYLDDEKRLQLAMSRNEPIDLSLGAPAGVQKTITFPTGETRVIKPAMARPGSSATPATGAGSAAPATTGGAGTGGPGAGAPATTGGGAVPATGGGTPRDVRGVGLFRAFGNALFGGTITGTQDKFKVAEDNARQERSNIMSAAELGKLDQFGFSVSVPPKPNVASFNKKGQYEMAVAKWEAQVEKAVRSDPKFAESNYAGLEKEAEKAGELAAQRGSTPTSGSVAARIGNALGAFYRAKVVGPERGASSFATVAGEAISSGPRPKAAPLTGTPGIGSVVQPSRISSLS